MVLTRAKAAQAAAAAARQERANNIAAAQRVNNPATNSNSGDDDAWSVTAVKGRGSGLGRNKKPEEPTTIIAPTKQSRSSAPGLSSNNPIIIDDNVENTNTAPLTPFEQYLRKEFTGTHSAALPKPQHSTVERARDRNRMDSERRREHKMMLRFTQETGKTPLQARPAIAAVWDTPPPTTSRPTSHAEEAGKALDGTLDEILNVPQANATNIPQTKAPDVPRVATSTVPNIPQATNPNVPQAETGIFRMHDSRLRALPAMSSGATGGGLLQLSMGSAPNSTTTAVPRMVTGVNDIAIGPSRFTSFRRVSAQPSNNVMATTQPGDPSINRVAAPQVNDPPVNWESLYAADFSSHSTAGQPSNNAAAIVQPSNAGATPTLPQSKPVTSTTNVIATVDALQAILGRNFMNRRFLFQAAPAISFGKNPGVKQQTTRKFAQLGEAAHRLALFEKHHQKVLVNVQKIYDARRKVSNMVAVAKKSGLIAFAGPNPSEKCITQLVLALIGATHLDGGLGAAIAVMEKLELL
jgi:hypothetical protein